MTLQPLFGQQIKAARTACGYTRKDLSALVGLDTNSIARIERGEMGVRWTTLERFISVLKQPAAFYFSHESPPPRNTQPEQIRSYIEKALADETIRAHVARVLAAFAEK